MPLKSDINIAAVKFDPAVVSQQTHKLNQHLIDIFKLGPRWYEVGAAKYRELRINGQTPLPKPAPSPEALDVQIPSREPGREIPCRLVYPSSRKSPTERMKCKGTVMHIHGGGWVLGDHTSTDALLEHYAEAGDLAVLSIGYRLAPEDSFPKGPEDCIDAALFLAKTSEKEYGGPLRFIGGESAGGHLSLVVAFELLRTQPTLKLSGLLLHFGCFDMTFLPQVRNFRKPLILDLDLIKKFGDAFLPNMTLEQRKDPSVSPLYEDLERFRGRLPSALFTCGTEDALLDDSVAMGTKWLMAGGEAIIKIYPGACHGFLAFSSDVLPLAGEALGDTKTYIQEMMAKC